MFYFLMDFVIIILEVVCCQMFFDVFYHDEEMNQHLPCSKLAAVLTLGSLCYLAARFLNDKIFIKQIVVFLLIVVVMTFVRGFPYKKSVVLALLFQGILTVMEYLALIFVQMVIPDIEKMDTTQEVMGRVVIIINLLFCFIVVLLISRIYRMHKNKMIFHEEWLKYIIFPIVTMIMLSAILSVFKSETDIKQIQVLCAVGLGLVVLNFLMFFLLEDVIRQEEAIREMESFEIQGNHQLEMYRKLTETFEIQKSETHEFKNHIMCIQSLAEDNRYEELKNYIQTINGDLQADGAVIDTNNTIINAVINTKYKEAAKKHIVVVFRVNDLSQIKMEDKDLVILLSNLLNNAIEASDKCKDKVIQFKFMMEYGNVLLSVKNHYAEDLRPVEGGFLTTKKDGKYFHGVGIKNILKVVDKYEGTYDISIDGNEFFFSLFIPEQMA